MFCAHFEKNLQISTLFLNTGKNSIENAEMSQQRFDVSHAHFGHVLRTFWEKLARFDMSQPRFGMFSAHFEKNLQISTLFLNTGKYSIENAEMSQQRFDVSPAHFGMFCAH